MKIHEYQAKDLFVKYGVPTQAHEVVDNGADAERAAKKIGTKVVIKAQVLVGGRGKAGGVKLADTPEEAKQAAEEILKLTIKDIPVEKVMIAEAAEIQREYYLGLTVDRTAKKLVLMMSKAGGVDIEELAVNQPDQIVMVHIDPVSGVSGADVDSALAKVFDEENLRSQATEAVQKLYTLVQETDASLVEINPYALVDGNRLLALDAKINFDDNALYKHPEIDEMRNNEEYSEDEIEARSHGLSFVSMDGEIGCIVNGAGLAMATMDIIKLYGGDPANFLDVGGSSNPEKVLNALRIIMNNRKVKAILINIFGGITRCDDIANGILMAMKQIDIDVPMVVRLIGTNEEEGRRLLSEAGFEVAEQLGSAVEKVVASA
jgi:succinyl-CoA synthetase beta subunit